MVDLGGYVIVLVEKDGKIKLFGKFNLLTRKSYVRTKRVLKWANRLKPLGFPQKLLGFWLKVMASISDVTNHEATKFDLFLSQNLEII